MPPPLAACLTPAGRGALAVIAFAGAARQLDAAGLFRSRRGLDVIALPSGEPIYGLWGNAATPIPPEDVVLIRRDALRLEVHCHGGTAAVERILSDLAAVGARRLTSAEWIEAMDGRLSAELQSALAAATTWKTARLILAQWQAPGGMADILRRLRDQAGNDADLMANDASLRTILGAIDSALSWSRFGLHLAQPWDVTLSGPPNVGKSSLLNAIVGYSRAIVSPIAGTTRDIVTADTAIDGWPIRFSDTAGLRETDDHLERSGVERARARIASANLNLRLIDPSVSPGEFAPIGTDDATGLASTDLVIAHKSDLPKSPGVDVPPGAIPVSSRTGSGLDDLFNAIIARLIPQVPQAGTAIPVTQSQIDLLQQLRVDLLARDLPAIRRRLDAWLQPSWPPVAADETQSLQPSSKRDDGDQRTNQSNR